MQPVESPNEARPSPQPRRWWTLANGLTLVRLLLAPALAASLARNQAVPALVVFATAIATDLVDGRVARLRGEVTPFGGFFDHVTDAIFVATGLLVLALRGIVPLALPILLLMAFLQYSVDSRVVAGRPLRASRLGRWNGIAYFVVLGTPIIRDGLGLTFPDDALVGWIGVALVVSTLASMADRALALLRR
jgi:phosphatidylglycerophosphate synthase